MALFSGMMTESRRGMQFCLASRASLHCWHVLLRYAFSLAM